jgi:hypothetical protein
MSRITIDELLAEYERIREQAPAGADGMTTGELCEILHCGDATARRFLQHAQGMGILRVGRRYVRNITGVMQSKPCYWIERPKEKKKGK